MSDDNKDKNVSRRNFLKKMASTAVFTVPTIHTFSVLQVRRGWWWWTGHHHHSSEHGQTPPLPPPPPPGFGGD